jgi:hypothetical protein
MSKEERRSIGRNILRGTRKPLELWRRMFAHSTHTPPRLKDSPDDRGWDSVSTIDDIDSETAEDGGLALCRFDRTADTIPNIDVNTETARAILFWCVHNLEAPLVTEPDRLLEPACPTCQRSYSREHADRMPVRVNGIAGCDDHTFCNRCITKSISSRGRHMNKCPRCRTEIVPTKDGCLLPPVEDPEIIHNGEAEHESGPSSIEDEGELKLVEWLASLTRNEGT